MAEILCSLLSNWCYFFLKANEICINAHTQYWNTLYIENFRVLKENLEPKFRKKIHEVLWNL